jgi:hypothetical protein
MGITGEHIFQKRQDSKPGCCGPCNRDRREPRPMTDHSTMVGRQPHIEFKTVTAVLQGQVKGRKRVLSNMIRARAQAAMSEKKRTPHGALFYARVRRKILRRSVSEKRRPSPPSTYPLRIRAVAGPLQTCGSCPTGDRKLLRHSRLSPTEGPQFCFRHRL